jgi:hypothetical protein
MRIRAGVDGIHHLAHARCVRRILAGSTTISFSRKTMRTLLATMAGAGIGLGAATASGYVIEYRIVERVEGVNYVIPDNRIDVRPNSIHRYRIQFRVVPENANEALGGFISWGVGVIDTTGGLNYRTGNTPNPNPRGRLAPFTWPGSRQSEGSPAQDPFTRLTGIDCNSNMIATWPDWECDGEGNPLPRPAPTIYGRGEFVSLYEITSGATTSSYTITYSGNMRAGNTWNYVSCPEPDCGESGDPDDDLVSPCVWSPVTLPLVNFSCTLTITVCTAEWNEDGRLNSQDMFDYLADFFANDADFNGDGTTGSDDIYGFIDGFFTHCN